MPSRLWRHSGLPPQPLRVYLMLFSLALVTPLLALALFALTKMAGIQQVEIERRIEQIAADLADDIDRELDRASIVLETLATSAELKRGDYQAFHTQALLTLKRTNAAIVLIDRSNQQLVSTLREYGAPLPETADRETAQRVVTTKQRQVSNVFRGSVSGRPVFNVEVPVFDEKQEVRYILIMSVQASHIADVLRGANLQPPWLTGVIDNNGIILARSERHDEFVGKALPADLLEQSRKAKGVYRGVSVAGENIARATHRSQIAGWLVSGGGIDFMRPWTERIYGIPPEQYDCRTRIFQPADRSEIAFRIF